MKELKERFNANLRAQREIAARAEAEGRGFTDEERADLKAKQAELADLGKQIANHPSNEDDGLKLAMASLVEFDGPVETPAAAPKGRRETIGAKFVNSPQFKDFMAQFPGGRIPDSANGLRSAPVFYNDLLTGASDTSAGAFVATDITGIYESLGRRPLTIRDIISVRQTDSDLVEFVRQVTRVNAAAPVKEAVSAYAIGATDPDGTIGVVDAVEAGVKPESEMTFEKVTTPVITIAHWVPATKRSLSDASQLRGIIDQELRDGLEDELEDQIMEGSGSGENFRGIGNTVGVQAQAWDTNILTTTRKARTKVRTVGRAIPTAFVLHPNDWETIDLLQDNEARYYAGGPFNLMTPRLWGLPVVESEAVTAGIGYVGDFRKAVLWDREAASISVSDSHADFFIRNLVAILAELRAAFGVIRPTAFVEIDLTA